MVWYVAAGGVAGALVLLLLVPVRVHLQARLEAGRQIEAEVRWLVLRRRFRRRWRVQPDRLVRMLVRRLAGRRSGRPARKRPRVGGWLRRARRGPGGGQAAWRYLAPRLRVERLSVRLQVGAGDAMLTGLACSALWSLAGAGAAAALGRLRLRPGALHLAVVPVFGPACLRGRLEGQVRARLWHLAVAAWRAARGGARGRRSGAPARRLGSQTLVGRKVSP